MLLIMPAPALAAGDAVTLRDAVRLALERNHLIKAAEHEKTAARYGAAAGRGRWFPRIFLDEGFAASNSPTRVFMMKLDEGRFTQNDFLISNLNHPASTSDFRTSFTLEQPVFDLGIVYGSEVADKEAEVKDFAARRRSEEVGFAVFSACVEVQRARAMMETAGNAVRDAREHLRLARVRNREGTGLRSDELRAGTFLAEMEQQLITAGNNSALAGMRLAVATGGDPGDSLDIAEPLTVLPVGAGPDALVTIALSHRPDLLEMEKGVEKSAAGVKLAASAFLPTLYGSASYQMNDRDIPFGRDNDAWIAGVNLRWELFDGSRRLDERARARSLESSARETLEQYRKEVALQVRESLLRREETAQRLAVARSACREAEEGVRLITKRFANSLATLVEVLDAQTALNRARAGVVENETGYALATARVWFSAGIFLQEVMK
jgi:outer membrane protein TolC